MDTTAAILAPGTNKCNHNPEPVASMSSLERARLQPRRNVLDINRGFSRRGNLS